VISQTAHWPGLTPERYEAYLPDTGERGSLERMVSTHWEPSLLGTDEAVFSAADVSGRHPVRAQSSQFGAAPAVSPAVRIS
jgi:hypothetical protein